MSISLYLKQIEDIFLKFKPAIFCGAGISVDKPSNLPTAKTLLYYFNQKMSEIISSNTAIVSNIPDFNYWANFLRFEEVVSIFYRLGIYKEALTPLNSSYSPNSNHYILSYLYKNGYPIITTNFDILIELAILNSGLKLNQFVNHEDYMKIDTVDNAVYKLHGSFWEWKNKKWYDSHDSICATFEHLGFQFSQYLNNYPQRQFLVNMINNRPLIVIGYSGNDDFDISPIIISAFRKQPLIWIQHSNKEQDLLIAKNLKEIPIHLHNEVPKELFSSGHVNDIFYVRFNTNKFLKKLVQNIDSRLTFNYINSNKSTLSSEYLSGYSTPLVLNKFLACLFFGFIYQELENYDKALYMFKYSDINNEDKYSDNMSLFIQYEIARTHKLMGQCVQAAKLSEECYKKAKNNNDFQVECAALHLLGNCTEEVSLKKSIEYYEVALKLSIIKGLSNLTGLILKDIGSNLWKQKKIDEAYKILLEAHQLLENSGLLEELSKCKHELAVNEIESGRLDKARLYLEDEIELIKKLGNYKMMPIVMLEFGIIEYKLGQFDNAIKYFDQAIDFAIHYDDWRSISLSKYYKGWIAFEKDDLSSAISLEKESSKFLELHAQYYYLAHNLQLRTVIFLAQGKIAEGRKCLNGSIKMSEDVGDQVNITNCKGILNSLDKIEVTEGKPLKLLLKK